MDLSEVEKLLKKYDINDLNELEGYLDINKNLDDCKGDPVRTKKNCLNSNCYEDGFVPDCRKIIEIYNKYFKDDIKSKKMFIEYLTSNTEKKSSSIENYMSCKSCNKQMQKAIKESNKNSDWMSNISLKISDSDFKKDFCKNLAKKFDYATLFISDYTSIQQFLNKEHQVTHSNYQAPFTHEETDMTKDEDKKLFDITHVSKSELKLNLEKISNLEGSTAYKMNLAIAAFDRNLLEESYRLVEDLSNDNDFTNNIQLLQLKAKVLSNKQMDKEAIVILEKLIEITKPNIDAETHNLLAASIKREAFSEFKAYADEVLLKEKLNHSKEIYQSLYSLSYDYYPALNYMYLVAMVSYMNQESSDNVTAYRNDFYKIWKNVDLTINDWWSYMAGIEFQIIQGEYISALEKLKAHFEGVDDFEVSDFNVLSTLRQLKLYSEFCNDIGLKEIILYLEATKK